MNRYSCDRCGKQTTPEQHFKYGAEVQYTVRDSVFCQPRGYNIKRRKLCSNCKKQLKQFMLGKEIEPLNIIRNKEDKPDDDNYFFKGW